MVEGEDTVATTHPVTDLVVACLPKGKGTRPFQSAEQRSFNLVNSEIEPEETVR
jgi:hypothetical protein